MQITNVKHITVCPETQASIAAYELEDFTELVWDGCLVEREMRCNPMLVVMFGGEFIATITQYPNGFTVQSEMLKLFGFAGDLKVVMNEILLKINQHYQDFA
jgi:hypothetical protein